MSYGIGVIGKSVHFYKLCAMHYSCDWMIQHVLRNEKDKSNKIREKKLSVLCCWLMTETYDM